MATTVTIPDFDFSGFYYSQILDNLRRYARQNVPELTDESDFEPFTQIMRMQALVGHLNNTLIDLVANESTLPTARLTEQVRNMLRLIAYEMKPATPSQVDILYTLSKVFNAGFEVISERAQAATARSGDSPVIYFEALEALSISRTDQFTKVLVWQNAGGWVDNTAAANNPTPTNWEVFPVDDTNVGDAVYFIHDSVMWDELEVVGLPTPGANFDGVWEFYDGNWRKTTPTSVTNLGASLEFDLTSYLGTQNRQGTVVRVELNETTAYQEVTSTWNGTKNVATTGFLGQSVPTTDVAKYTIGSDWEVLSGGTDATNRFRAAGKFTFPLPQTLSRNWKKTTVNGQEGYALRFRLTSVSGPTYPVAQRVRMDTGKQYVLRQCTQGRTQTDNPLGSSTGLANQIMETSKDYFIDGSEEVTVDGEVWLRVSNFLASNPTDRHYRIVLGKNDRASVVFGDGNAGRIPPLGVGNVAITYRHGANDNGNAGAGTVTSDKTGLTYVSSVTNPRAATGWAEAEGASATSLERAKIAGPASLRTKTVAIGPDDVVELAKSYTDDAGARPFARAKAFEEGFGPKTIELVVAPNGGGLATNDQLAAIQTYFNGDTTSHPMKPKHLVANQQVVAVNYTQKVIDIAASVVGDCDKSVIEAWLNQVFQPDALDDDGVSFLWEFGHEVPLSRIIHEIHQAHPSIRKVTLTTPAANVALQPRELPKIGTVTITVTSS